MLYTEDFSMHHYVGFSQIGSHLLITHARVGLWELCSKFPSLFYSEFLLEIHHYAHFYSFYASDFINIPKYFLTF